MTRVSVFAVTAIAFGCLLWAVHFFILPGLTARPYGATYLILTFVGIAVVSSLFFLWLLAGFERARRSQTKDNSG